MKKQSILLPSLAAALFLLTACAAPYREADFVGKTSQEIEEAYGPFECITMPASEDGRYRSCRCGYTVAKPWTGFWGTAPEKLFFILFDDNGIAVSCEEGYRPGG